VTPQADPDIPPDGRPVDVDTGFWLWVAALPLTVAGYLINVLASNDSHPSTPILAVSIVFVLVVAAVVLTFQILMRHGYRWARTVLTGGGIAAVVYMAISLFTVDRPPAAAVGYAVSSILGAVSILGGVFLLHRKDAQAFFTR
jgi:hypothetical protein